MRTPRRASPHWPEAAEKISWFYQEENQYLSGKDQINDFNGEFNGIIGITPELDGWVERYLAPACARG